MKKRLFFLPMVAIMMAACSSNDTIEVNENKGDLISFRPIVKGVTRAADVNTDNLASFPILIMAYSTSLVPFLLAKANTIGLLQDHWTSMHIALQEIAR